MIHNLKQRNQKFTFVGLRTETQNGWQYIMAFREDEAIEKKIEMQCRMIRQWKPKNSKDMT